MFYRVRVEDKKHGDRILLSKETPRDQRRVPLTVNFDSRLVIHTNHDKPTIKKILESRLLVLYTHMLSGTYICIDMYKNKHWQT